MNKHEQRADRWLNSFTIMTDGVASLAAEFAAVEAEARREAFEEAAKVAESFDPTIEKASGKCYYSCPDLIAEFIRVEALKAKAEEKHGDKA